MKLLKTVFIYLPILAVVFTAIYFYEQDLRFSFTSPDLISLSISMGLLLCVFLVRAFLWHYMLIKFQIDIGLPGAVESQFCSILFKYIPGKVWALLGKAHFVSKYGYSMKLCSLVSILFQGLMVLSGLLVGGFGLLYFDFLEISKFFIYILVGMCILLIIYLSKRRNLPFMEKRFMPRVLRSLSEQSLPPLHSIFFICVFQWLILGAAYCVFISSIGFNLGYYPLLLQPLANNVGILATFAPGGLGVREGAMISYIYAAGVGITEATAISIAARLWFISGECIIYMVGWLIHIKHKDPIVNSMDQ